MTLPAFNAAQHHIGLGEVVESLNGFLLGGGYTRRMVGDPFQRASNVGTDELISTERQSVWTQSDYTGGEFFHDWSDEAGFSECSHLIPNQLGTGVRTTRPLAPVWTNVAQQGVKPIFFDVIDGALYVVYTNEANLCKLVRFTNLGSFTPTTKMDTIDLPTSKIPRCAAFNSSTNKMWMGTSVPDVRIYNLDKTIVDPAKMFTILKTIKAPVVTSDPVTAVVAIHMMAPLKLIVTRHGAGDDNDRVWNHIKGDKWDNVGILPGQVVDTITYNNAVYILTKANGNQTQISMTQGDQIFPVTDIPYYFRGEKLIQYAGRLYILGTGQDLDGGPQVGELYEVTGTSLRLVRTFLPESMRPNGKAMRHMTCAAVAEGVLWMPDSNTSGFEVYDAVTDAFFGGPALATGYDSNIKWTGLCPAGTALFAWSSGVTKPTTGLYRSYQNTEDSAPYTPFLITSNFDVEPSREKLWGEVVVRSRELPVNCAVSTDAGETWLDIGADPVKSKQQGYTFETVFDLSGVEPSRGIKLSFSFDMTGLGFVPEQIISNPVPNQPPTYHPNPPGSTPPPPPPPPHARRPVIGVIIPGHDGEFPAEILSHSLSFLVKTSGKKQWAFDILGADYITLMDDTFDTVDPVELSSQLWDWVTDATPLIFRDRTGDYHRVVISMFQENQPQVTKEQEAFYRVQLTEL